MNHRLLLLALSPLISLFIMVVIFILHGMYEARYLDVTDVEVCRQAIDVGVSGSKNACFRYYISGDRKYLLIIRKER